jgi:hypothetical protein
MLKKWQISITELVLWFYDATTHQKLRKTGLSSRMEFRIELGTSSLLHVFTMLYIF